MPSDLPPNDAAERNRLFEAFAVAISSAHSLLKQRSIHDPTYLEGDTDVPKIITRISEVLKRQNIDSHAAESRQDEVVHEDSSRATAEPIHAG